MDSSSAFLIGHHDSKRNVEISQSLTQQIHSANYDMLTFPITTPQFHSRVLSLLSNHFSDASNGHDDLPASGISSIVVDPLEPVDTQLTPDGSTNLIIGLTSSWIDLSSPDPIIADVSRQVLSLELAYAAFCGVSYVLVHGPRGNDNSDVPAYARAILDGLNQGPYMQIYIWTQMIPNISDSHALVGDLASFGRRDFVAAYESNEGSTSIFRTWQDWDTIRSICKYSTRLNIALLIPRQIPPEPILSRWYSEPVRILTLNSDTFRKNSKGYPSLPAEHQDYILRLAKLKVQPWFLICDATPLKEIASEPGKATDGQFPTLDEAKNMSPNDEDHHIAYLRHLQTRQSSDSAMDQFGSGYQDYLQAPLQPLTVNLESITYEVFEKDPIKYEWYERATARALHDWIEQGKPTSNPDGRPVVAVVGAGRGPLVSRALKAASDVGVDIDMWALEKNPNAFVLLQRHNASKWENQVNLVKSDMRTWQGPESTQDLSAVRKTYNIDPDEQGMDLTPSHTESASSNQELSPPNHVALQNNRYKIDILISELLGSFADNELSPECLDGVQHLLNPVHGISIPASYSAHFTPVAAPKLHADISLSMLNVNPTAAEIPYVVMLDQVDLLSSVTVDVEPEAPVTRPTKAKSFASLFSNASNHNGGKMSNSTSQVHQGTSKSSPTTFYTITTAWSFHHPNPRLPPTTRSLNPSNSHNARHCKRAFHIPNPGTCHGLAGYFETVLYPGVELSTNPLTMEDKSPGMISWFPIFFPFKSPIFLAEEAVVVVSMWRRTDDRRVWYEWMMEVFSVVGKRRIKLGATELHSSEKEACLM